MARSGGEHYAEPGDLDLLLVEVLPVENAGQRGSA
jgi:hypothetical protein